MSELCLGNPKVGIHIASPRHMGSIDGMIVTENGSQLAGVRVGEGRSTTLSLRLAFLTGMIVQISIPLTNLYDIPNVRAVFFALISGVFVFQFLNGKPIRAGSLLLVSYLGLSIVLTAGIMYSRAPMYGASKVILVSAYFWMLGTVIYNLMDELSIGRAFLNGLLVGGLLLIGITAAEFGNPVQMFQRADRFFRLRFGDEGNPIMLARHLALAITTIIMYVAIRRKWVDLAWSTPFILLALVYLMGTGSKGPLLALVLSCIITALLFMKGAVARLSLTILTLGFVLAVSVGAVELLPKGFVEERFTEKVQTLSLRLPAYRDVMQTLLEADAMTLLVGHGTGDYGYFALGHDVRAYPHNVLLEVTFENGLIGVSLLLVALGCPLVAVLRATRRSLQYSHRVLLAGLFASYVASVINAQFTGDLGANLLIGMFGAATTRISLFTSTDRER